MNTPITLPRHGIVSAEDAHAGNQVATLETFALDADRVLARKSMLQKVMERVMIKDEHYGVIPGCGTKQKPSLFKPGAEAIASTFQLCPRYQINKTDLPGEHREYEIICELYNPAGGFIGSGVGAATTKEGKYRFRVGGGEITSVPVPKAYWDRRKEDPKGAAKLLRDAAQAAGIEGENFGAQKNDDGLWMISSKSADSRVEHDNPADYYNTVLKMGKKRAFVDAVLTATGASDIFTQDIEDMPEVIPGAAQGKKGAKQEAKHAPFQQIADEINACQTVQALRGLWSARAKEWGRHPQFNAISTLVADMDRELVAMADAAPSALDKMDQLKM
jgi:hypothetical protein